MAARPTLSDVARSAGVSLATASRAINGSSDRSVRPELAERVLRAARDLGYVPDATAQAMARGHTTTLGLLVHDIADPYFSAIAAGVIRTAEAAGLQVTLTTTQNDAAREAALVDLMRKGRARAVVLAGGRTTAATPELASLADAVTAFRRDGGGLAVIGQALPGTPTVAVDNAGGATALSAALLALGYRRFAIIAGPPDRVTAAERLQGVRAALEAGGAHIERVLECPFTWEGGHDAAARLFDEGHRSQIILATNDVMALGALAAARERGVSVPGDVALAGFGGVASLRDVVPSLTTVAIPMDRLGEIATAMALETVDIDSPEPKVVTVAGSVVVGDSTPPLPPAP